MKKWLSLLLTGLLALALTALPATAETVGDYVFKAETGAIKDYVGPGGDVVVPEEIDGVKVVRLDNGALLSDETITSLVLPDSITVFDEYAIGSLGSVTSIKLPANLTVINVGNLSNMDSLEEITIPPKVRTIAPSSLAFSSNLKTVRFEGECPEIQTASFTWLSKEVVFYVPDDQLDAYTAALPAGANVQPSGQNAIVFDWNAPESDFEFDAATGTITGYTGPGMEVIFPGTIGGVPITAIGPGAFEDNRDLSSITLPDTITEIGDNAFASARNLRAVHFPAALTTVGDNAFYLCSIMELELPDGVTSIGDHAFENNYCGTELYLPAGLKTIGESAFERTAATDVYIPAGVERIGARAFADTYGLTYAAFENGDRAVLIQVHGDAHAEI